ncbi:1,4-alpha-glucan branching enzyme GlgB [Thermopolyspora flexuosa]|uniref:1,4-alpha-glucan branching enzyme GlgB n=1 Tax=Thermopolyspora flexuosa TaxID=103836 RepID=A0A543ITT0_9ACTN|nr:1,4-alpha-glucan branching protein GlgB [Thermopolyspora flexuosa]TQM73957.1 1,4-alpha-glucan branching enzyme [Thermopolyspora flexuosa]GGM93513.1 1,4-alpha-glucan branching enzyme GlgB [Thermopolyspora flexuosa]
MDAELDRLAGGAHHDPHSILGAHPGPDGVTIRALRPLAEKVEVLIGDEAREMTHVAHGVFATTIPGLDKIPDYRLRVTYAGCEPQVVHDPYRHWPTIGELDLHLIGEGRHERLWEVLGARVMRHEDVDGTAFAVWAPNARGVRLIGDFNHWDGQGYPMRSLGRSGVWELFVPGIGPGERYKFAVLGVDGVWREKADPMARRTEVPPATASIVERSTYEWQDDEWMARRASRRPLEEPMSVYEVHLGSWRPGLSYRDLATELVEYVTDMGFTHVEFLPVAEHPYGPSWGYQVTSYYAPTARFGTPDDFRYLVDRLHQAGIGVLLDWVPAHFPMDDWALGRFDGTALYEHPDPKRGYHPDWGTYVFDYGRNEVRNFLVANALYWLKEFHIDGLRVDAVASMLYLDYSRPEGEWTPNIYGGRENIEAVEFLKELNTVCYREVPGIVTIAEESTAWPGVSRPVYLGGLGFGFKWNMGWMHDTLAYLRHEPIYRQYHHHQMTFSLMYAYSENFVLPLSHDEVVHGKGSLLGKMPGDEWQRFANLRALLAYMWAHPGKQLLFMGGEFGQGSEWSEQRGLDWWVLDFDFHQGVQRLVRDLNRIYTSTPALYTQDHTPDGFRWIDADDAQGNVFSFLRYGTDGSVLACVANFAGVPHEDYHLGLPEPGVWEEILNTDAYEYAGSGVGNLGRVEAVDVPRHGLPYSARLRVPPLGVLWLRPARRTDPAEEGPAETTAPRV